MCCVFIYVIKVIHILQMLHTKLRKNGRVVLEKKIDVNRWQMPAMAIGHLSDAGDLKTHNWNYTYCLLHFLYTCTQRWGLPLLCVSMMEFYIANVYVILWYWKALYRLIKNVLMNDCSSTTYIYFKIIDSKH